MAFKGFLGPVYITSCKPDYNNMRSTDYIKYNMRSLGSKVRVRRILTQMNRMIKSDQPPPHPSNPRAVVPTPTPKPKVPKSLSFSHLFSKCMRQYAWNPEKTAILVEEFLEKFMVIKAKLRDFDGVLCRPSPLISLVWRVAAVHYEKTYRKSCWKAFKFVDSDLNWKEESRNDAYLVTLETYDLLFPLSPHSSAACPEMSWLAKIGPFLSSSP